MNGLKVRSFVMRSGERFCLLVERQTGVPAFAPNLFLMTQVRNASLSAAALVAYAGHIKVLHDFLAGYHIDIAQRIHNHEFLRDPELDALRDWCAYRFSQRRGVTGPDLTDTPRFDSPPPDRVSKACQYCRLSAAACYLYWLGRQYLDHMREEPLGLEKMAAAIRSHRPRSSMRNKGLVDRAIDETGMIALFSVIDTISTLNPFTQPVRRRNRLMILLEYELGIRAGELLNLRVEDFDFAGNQVRIIRRADQLDDPRTRQPLVKTLDRVLPVSDWLISEVHDYILNDRRALPNARRCPYLFLTYKAGPTLGQPLSIASYNKVWHAIQNAAPELKIVTGHRLRHTWNNRFSESMDASHNDISEARQEAMRSTLQGWKQGSGTAARYNRRFVIKKAHEVSLQLQKCFFVKDGDDD